MHIEQAACNMSPAFIKGVKKNLSEASIFFDRFHVVKLINEEVDKVRKESVKDKPLLKRSKYIFLSKSEIMTEEQLVRLEGICLS